MEAPPSRSRSSCFWAESAALASDCRGVKASGAPFRSTLATMRLCPSCGESNPDRARFCLACGTSVGEAADQHEERKVVSVLFVDLVGFTAQSGDADPEDVRSTLRPYHARVKAELERLGGTVEKF